MDLGSAIRSAINRIAGKVIDEAAVRMLVRDLQRALIIADVNVELVHKLSRRIEERALKEKPAAGMSMKQHVMKVVYEELTGLMGEGRKLELKKQKIMVLGLFGSGKTTQIGKIARWLKHRGMSVGVICADVSRPAAYEQLQQLAKQVGCEFYGEKGNTKAWEVVRNGIMKLRNEVVIVDTSGRSALDPELIDELKRVNDVLQPNEKILVMSADIGQVARRQAEEFHSAVGLTGVILTKMDGSGKGGGALTATAASGAKIMFIGIGEKMDDIEEFAPDKFVGRLLGVPDFEALIEKIKKIAPEVQEKGVPERFDVKTFYEQLKTAKRMGPLKGIFQSMGFVDVPKEALEEGEKKLEEYEAIISSMTKQERENPDIIKKQPTRMERIAKGSGTSIEAVRSFLSQFAKMKKMYEQLQRNKGMQKQLERFLKKGKGIGG
ncbi:MAG: signal recognition particle receptor subunit alpha [Candidatus Micrarchaeia archaeon]